MAFIRRYKKRYNRNKTLSARNIYSNKSAKSQSKQIYALKKRINTVYRRTKPEIKVFDGTNSTYSFDSQTLLNTYKIIPFDGPWKGSEDDNRIGDLIKCLSYTIYFTGEYYNSSNTGYHDSESAGTPFRIIVFQKKTSNNDSPSIGEILSRTSGSGADYTNQAICPLKKGVTEKYKILADRKFTFTINRNQQLKTIKCRPNNMRWDANNYANGLYILLISAGLHFDNNFSEFVKGTVMSKLTFTDV